MEKCVLCGSQFAKKADHQKFCSESCRHRNKYLKNKEKIKKRSLKYYYDNKDKVLKQQSILWSKKYKTDQEFRKKRQLRDASRKIKKKIPDGQSCVLCGSKIDLQRHHPSYKSTKTIILCRGCHNMEHTRIKRGRTITSDSVSSGRR